MGKTFTRCYRSYFENWKSKSEMLEVIRFNNEEGPMAMEVYEIEAEIRNLKIMLDDKMILNEDQMNKKLEENEQAYIDKINRAKIRL